MIHFIRQILGPLPCIRVWDTRVEKVENSPDIAIEVMGTVPRAGQYKGGKPFAPSIAVLGEIHVLE